MVVPLLVREVMQTPVENVSADAPIVDVAGRFQTMTEGAVVVVHDGEPVGIVTRTDLIDCLPDGETTTDGETAS